MFSALAAVTAATCATESVCGLVERAKLQQGLGNMAASARHLLSAVPSQGTMSRRAASVPQHALHAAANGRPTTGREKPYAFPSAVKPALESGACSELWS